LEIGFFVSEAFFVVKFEKLERFKNIWPLDGAEKRLREIQNVISKKLTVRWRCKPQERNSKSKMTANFKVNILKNQFNHSLKLQINKHTPEQQC
jgi:hypothetical protein